VARRNVDAVDIRQTEEIPEKEAEQLRIENEYLELLPRVAGAWSESATGKSPADDGPDDQPGH